MKTSPTQPFEAAVLPHLDAAYNLARWLLRDPHAAQDVVQDAFLRAFRYFDSFRGGDARPWLLRIVRNACFTRLAEQSGQAQAVALDEDGTGIEMADPAPDADPAAALDHKRMQVRIDAAIRSLAPAFREVIVLREIEGISYEEIAQVAAIPVGTVMSRLSRARALLRSALAELAEQARER